MVQCLGFAKVKSRKPVSKETIFNIGSISKIFSAWGFMQLTEKGYLKLDEPVDQYVTRWKLPESQYVRQKLHYDVFLVIQQVFRYMATEVQNKEPNS